jgi:hypothetical protein
MRIRCALVLLLLLSHAILAQERVTLTVPEPKADNTAYRIERLHLDADRGTLSIYLLGVNDEPVNCHYTPTTNPTGAFLIVGLNKANLSSAYAGNATTGSLRQRIFHRLVIMAEATAVCSKPLAGTLTGAVP